MIEVIATAILIIALFSLGMLIKGEVKNYLNKERK